MEANENNTLDMFEMRGEPVAKTWDKILEETARGVAENPPLPDEDGKPEDAKPKVYVIHHPEESEAASNDSAPEDDGNEADEESQDSPPKLIDPDNPLTDMSMAQIGQLLSQIGDMVRTMESNWDATRQEFCLKETHMRQLHVLNTKYKDPMPEGLSEEEQEQWDEFNGFDKASMEEIIAIFGESHPIIGVDLTQTVCRLKDASKDFFFWIDALNEYRSINDAYMQLVEIEERKNIEELAAIAEKEPDPEKKAAMQASIQNYWNQKELKFLADPLDEADIKRLASTITDQNKTNYLLRRSVDKLKQMGISPKFIMQMSKFETRFMDEKYHKQDNILLLWFASSITYCDCTDKNNPTRVKMLYFVFGIDRVIRKVISPEDAEKIMANITAFEDQFLNYIQ